jgi:hypothetical protein
LGHFDFPQFPPFLTGTVLLLQLSAEMPSNREGHISPYPLGGTEYVVFPSSEGNRIHDRRGPCGFPRRISGVYMQTCTSAQVPFQWSQIIRWNDPASISENSK